MNVARRLLALSLLAVAPVVARAQYPEVVTRSRIDHARGVDFHALMTPDTVYVGQQASYQLAVFLNQDTKQRLRRNPEFLPPESRSMLSYDLPDRGGVFNGTIDGRIYEIHVFRRALFPLTPGRYAMPAARLTYALPQGSTFFSREDSYTLRSEAATVVAIDPPTVGRPPDWLGAVGTWRASARIDTARGRAGDPIVLTIRVEGVGNATLLPRPPLTIPWASVVAADERVTLDSTPTALRGAKEFDWLVTPGAAGVQQVPAIRYVYFNPFTRRYEVALTQPTGVRVAAGDVVALDRPATAQPAEPLPLRTAIGDETPLPLGDADVLRLVLLLAPIPALAGWIVRRPRRVRRSATPADRLNAWARRPESLPATDVRRLFLAAVRERTGLDAARLTDRGAWSRALRLEGVADDTARDAEAMIDGLDAAVFGDASHAGADLSVRAGELFRRIDREAVRASSAPALVRAGAAMTLVVAAVAGGTLYARDVDRAREPFAQGEAAYAGADFVRAARLFEDAARAAPRAASAWANAGTAAWMAGDTAHAVVGWQRALRLDPTAPELRDRLSLVRAPQDAGLARVIALPSRLPSEVAVVLWIAGWALVARQSWRRRPALPAILLTLVLGAPCMAAARLFEDRLEGKGIVAVTDPVPLHALPALGSESGAMPLSGEIARLIGRQGVWSHIALDVGRDGWIPTERIAPLGRD